MAHPIEKKLVVDLSSKALFNLKKTEEISKEEGFLQTANFQTVYFMPLNQFIKI